MNTRIAVLATCLATTVGCPQGGVVDPGDAAGTETGEDLVCDSNTPTGLGVGQCAPEFSMPNRDNVEFSLYAQRGKVALVDISAIW